MKLQSQKGNAVIWIAISVLLVLAATGLWWWYSQKTYKEPTTTSTPSSTSKVPDSAQPLPDEDTTSAIQNDLNAIDTGANLKGDLDKELDADINNL